MDVLAAAAGSRVFPVRHHGNSFLGSVHERASLSCRFRTPFGKLSFTRIPLACSTQEVLDAAWEILEEFNKNDVKGLQQPSLESPDGEFALGASVLAAVEASRTQEGCQPLLGICASNCKQALTALEQWTSVLSCDFCIPQVLDSKHDLNSIPGPVYIKYNAHAKTSYLQSYTGKFRGVIVQIGQRQVGHLPLSLFS